MSDRRSFESLPHRPTWAQIDLANLRHNYRVLRQRLDPGAGLMAVLKANAYGHGAVECGRALEEIGVDWFGVALPEEGLQLRAGGIRGRIFCVGGFWEGQAAQLIAERITPAIFRLDMATELNEQARQAGQIVEYHLKVDTGMGRLGVRWDEVESFAAQLRSFDRIRLTGLLTHFASADDAAPEFTRLQIARYAEVLATLTSLGHEIRWRHLANSAGLHAFPEAHGTLARAGATLYGLVRDVLAPDHAPLDLRPVMSLHSRIILLKRVPAGTPLGYGGSFKTTRESLIATLPIGYADGVRRALSNCGLVLVGGRLVPIVGRVSMDLTIIDVTDAAGVGVGDEVVLLGDQGGERLCAEDLAATAGTISYEIVTGIGARVPRYYS
ncbi:MAG: alanine racemase [Acidobacteriota bacterium]